LYHFGFGLSYTDFRYGSPRLSRSSIGRNESTTVTVEVTNTGKTAGEEIVQMYIRDKVSSVTRPVKELRGFKRISLNAGETKTVTFGIDPEKLAFHNIEMNYVVEPSIFEIMTGCSSRDIDLQMTELNVES
jgi:beta-glucosidase